jgi:hypothetical protein
VHLLWDGGSKRHCGHACVSGGSGGGMERIFNQGRTCSSVRKQSYLHMLELVTHGWRWMCGLGGNDDVGGGVWIEKNC